MSVDEWVAQRERLGHAHERVVNRTIAMGVVFAHDVAGDAGRLQTRTIRPGAKIVHTPEDATVHRLEAVACIGQRAGHDDRHRVVEEGSLHLLLDLDRFDRAATREGGHRHDRITVITRTIGLGRRRRVTHMAP